MERCRGVESFLITARRSCASCLCIRADQAVEVQRLNSRLALAPLNPAWPELALRPLNLVGFKPSGETKWKPQGTLAGRRKKVHRMTWQMGAGCGYHAPPGMR